MALYDTLLEKMDGQPYSNYFLAFCPFHENTRTPALFVYESGQDFRCASCGKKGSLKFLAKKIGATYFAKSLPNKKILPNWQKWGDSLEEISSRSIKTLQRFPQFKKYYHKRKIDDDTITSLRFGYLSGWNLVPVQDVSGKLVDMVARATKDDAVRYVISPGDSKDRPLYCPNWERLKASDVVYVPFGIFDAVSFEMIGLASVTGITGKSLNPDLLRALQKRIILVPDAGEEIEAHRLANLMGWRARVREIRFPDSVKDPSGVREVYGLDVLKEMFA